MHVHVAIFKWKEGSSVAEVERALAQVRDVANHVKGIQAIYCGTNTSKWAQGFTHGVVVIGDSAEAIQAYRDHPIHVEAAAAIDKMEQDGIGIDFSDPS